MSYTDSGLSEEERLSWAGLKRMQAETSPIRRFVDTLRGEVEEYADFKEDIVGDPEDENDDGVEDYAGLQTYFEANGFETEEAEEFIQHIEASYPDFSEFEDFVDSINSYDAFINGFGTTATFSGDGETEDGDPLAGVRVHDEAGVSYNGVELPAGTVEVFGNRVEFSESDPKDEDDGEVTIGNFTVDPPSGDVNNFATVEFSVDVDNTNSSAQSVTLALTRDGSVVADQTVTVQGESTETVTFTQTGEDECADFRIEGAGPEMVCWTHPGLIQ